MEEKNISPYCKMLLDLYFTDKRKQILIQTQRNHYPYTLKDIGKISLSQIFFILRQLIKGFKCLYYKFGAFQVMEDCILINENFQVYCWISKQLPQNTCQNLNINEGQFINSFLKLLYFHQIKSNIGNQFKEKVKNCQNLKFQILSDLVEEFINLKHLNITSVNGFKQLFSSPKSLKNIFKKQQKYAKIQQNSANRILSLNSIRFSDKQIIDQFYNQQNLKDFKISSPIKNKNKLRQSVRSPQNSRKKQYIDIKIPYSAKIIKQSDQQTQISQKQVICQKLNQFKKIIRSNIQLSSNLMDKKLLNKNYQSEVNKQKSLLNNQNFGQFKNIFKNPEIQIDYRLNIDEKAVFHNCNKNNLKYMNLCKNLDEISGKQLDISIEWQNNMKQQNLNDKRMKQQKQFSNQIIRQNGIQGIKNKNSIQGKLFNKNMNKNNKNIFKFQLKTYESFQDSQYIKQINQDQNQFNKQFNNQNQQCIEQRKQLNLQISQFKEQLIKQNNFTNNYKYKNISFFDNLNSIASIKQMNQSIIIGKQIEKTYNSPVKLQKLDKFKFKTFQSIIQQGNTSQILFQSQQFLQNSIQ